VGDGTNLVIMLAGALLKEAEELLRMGLKPTEVAEGYELALEKALEILETLSCYEVKDISNKEEVKKVVKAAVMSKQYGNEEFLANLVRLLTGTYSIQHKFTKSPSPLSVINVLFSHLKFCLSTAIKNFGYICFLG
jgi:hypothetical protein